jgi:hypothetical protein
MVTGCSQPRRWRDSVVAITRTLEENGALCNSFNDCDPRRFGHMRLEQSLVATNKSFLAPSRLLTCHPVVAFSVCRRGSMTGQMMCHPMLR